MADVTYQLRRGPGVIGWYIAYPEAFADRNDITLAELNNEDLVIDITCAVDEEGTTFSLGDSETDDRYSYCDESGVDRPTFYNPEAEIAIYRDADRTATGQFKAALDLLLFPDVSYYIIKRVGYQDKTLAAGFEENDRIKVQYVKTDYGINTIAQGDPAMLTQTPLQQGWVNWNAIVPAA